MPVTEVSDTPRGKPSIAKLERLCLLPMVYQPSEYDVVCGRGKGVYEKFGNKKFRIIVKTYVAKISTHLFRKSNQEVIREITDIVRSQNKGCVYFVRKSEEHIGRWEELSAAETKIKVSQAFRSAEKVANGIGSQRSYPKTAYPTWRFLPQGQEMKNLKISWRNLITSLATSPYQDMADYNLDAEGLKDQCIKAQEWLNPITQPFENPIFNQYQLKMMPSTGEDSSFDQGELSWSSFHDLYDGSTHQQDSHGQVHEYFDTILPNTQASEFGQFLDDRLLEEQGNIGMLSASASLSSDLSGTRTSILADRNTMLESLTLRDISQLFICSTEQDTHTLPLFTNDELDVVLGSLDWGDSSMKCINENLWNLMEQPTFAHE